jgi:hypothetical protein
VRVALLALTLSLSAFAAQTVPDTLKHMAGCFSVTFAFVEDGAHDDLYKPVLERADLVSEAPLTLRRHLIIEGEEQLHWSEVWTPVDEANRIWRQRVTGPYGDFRYECEGTWTLNQWRCLAPKSAKPRRDRNRPYSHLDRENTLQLNGTRWVHAQNNRKVNADGSLYSVEAGWNVYERVDDRLCQAH